MNLLERAQVALSVVVMVIGVYIALSGRPKREVHAATRVGVASAWRYWA
jgi:hypothetical protein